MGDDQDGQNNGGTTLPAGGDGNQDGQNSGTSDPLANLQLSEEAKKQLQGNKELLDIITHNLTVKREANAQAKAQREELEKLKAEQAKAKEEELKKQGEFKKLYEKAQADLAEKDKRIQQVTINNKVSLLANQKGIKKASYLKMFDISGLEINDNLEVPELENKFDAFVKENPDLFGTGNNNNNNYSPDGGKPNIGSNSSLKAELENLEKAARTGNIREIARLREFKKTHGLMKTK